MNWPVCVEPLKRVQILTVNPTKQQLIDCRETTHDDWHFSNRKCRFGTLMAIDRKHLVKRLLG
jgi:hypothetical protein